jgi:hypothetical protein
MKLGTPGPGRIARVGTYNYMDKFRKAMLDWKDTRDV